MTGMRNWYLIFVRKRKQLSTLEDSPSEYY